MGLPARTGLGVRSIWLGLFFAGLVSQAVTAQGHLVIVSGLGGDKAHRDRFHDWATTMLDAARNRLGVPQSQILYLAERPERDPERIDAESTRSNVEAELVRLAGEAESDALVLILLIGHGSYQGDESRLSLPGPDMSAEDFARLLDLFKTQQVVFVNTASASGDFVAVLSGPGRTIVTATKSAFERNETMFCEYFVRAFAQDGADVDKDNMVSVLEAFNYARREVERVYESQSRLLTEHAMLDDNGDGAGSGEPDPYAGDGALAQRLFLGLAPGALVAAAADDSVLVLLYRRRQDLQNRIAELRSRKEAMDPATYERELESLLVQLARTAQEIREREGGRNRDRD